MMLIKKRSLIFIASLTLLALVLVFSYSEIAESKEDQLTSDNIHAENNGQFNFYGISFCFDKQQILDRTDIALESPAILLELELNGKSIKVSFLHLEDDELTGGIHTNLDINVQDVFLLLTEAPESANHDLVRQVMDVDAKTQVVHDRFDTLETYTLIRPAGHYSAIILLQPDREGGVMLAGEFDLDQSKSLLSHLRACTP